MAFDPNSLAFGGVSAFIIVLFVVQTIKEALSVDSKFVPMMAAVVAVSILLVGSLLPESLVTPIAQGLALAVAVSASVRYVKESPHGKNTQAREGNYVPVEGYRETEPTATGVSDQGGHTAVWNSGETQPLPDYSEEQWSGYRGG